MENKLNIPTGSLETYLPLYKELYKKYEHEFIDKQAQTEGGQQLKLQNSIHSHTKIGWEYFLLQDAWNTIKEKLDAPIIRCAKYKKGDQIIFIKEKFTPKDTPFEEHTKSTTFNVECIGIISDIKTSGLGNGEILYDIDGIFPECWESNPYAIEKNVIKLRNGKFE